MKLKFLFIIFLSFFYILNANEIKRKILVIHPEIELIFNENVHTKLASILNHYGYYVDFATNTLDDAPKNIDEYVGFITWDYSQKIKDPVKYIKYLTKFKNKKNMIIGDIPYIDKEGKNHLNEINVILKENFGFTFENFWTDNMSLVRQEYDKNLFDFEKKISFITKKDFIEIKTYDDSIKPLFKETYEDKISNSVFLANWGLFARANKIFYTSSQTGKNRWLADPFKLVSMVYDTNYPIPDTTTIEGKRVAYIHLDGDGILSKSFNGKYTIQNGLDFIKEQNIKTGVSFVTGELDEKNPIYKNPIYSHLKDFKPKLFNNYASKILNLKHVEPASHTHSHPFNWRKGMYAYAITDNDIKKVNYTENVIAYQTKNKKVDLQKEVIDSINYIQKLVPSKKVQTLYWTGDCYPSLRDLKFMDDNNILAMNGGDSRFDSQFNSYSYVTPIGLYNSVASQIYSSNSNENTYTDDWTKDHWRFKNITTTFKNTGYPKRIKPINLYYHFYAFAKKGSFNALKKTYDYLKNNNLAIIYPSVFMKKVKNFYDIKIEKISNTVFDISNLKDLREFRFEGNKKIEFNKSIKSVNYDYNLDVTYVTVVNDINKIRIKLSNE
mgnify:CR=1 FL=1